jgi:hypothetical protein
MNLPGFYQALKFHQIFIKKKIGKFTRVLPGFYEVFKFHQVFTKKTLVSSLGFHQVLKFHQFSGKFTRL